MQEVEILFEKLIQYSLLHDKLLKGYKDNYVANNAWWELRTFLRMVILYQVLKLKANTLLCVLHEVIISSGGHLVYCYHHMLYYYHVLFKKFEFSTFNFLTGDFFLGWPFSVGHFSRWYFSYGDFFRGNLPHNSRH